MDAYFLVQIKRTNGEFSKGVVVKDSLNAARQSYYAYLGAYGFEHEQGTDYVAAYIYGLNGICYDWKVDNRIYVETEEPDDEVEG